MTRLATGFVLVSISLLGLGCGSSSGCADACSRIESSCNSTSADCVEDCEDDLDSCPTEMQALLDCIGSSVLECDPDQDQGLAEAPCEAEHAALSDCGADAF